MTGGRSGYEGGPPDPSIRRDVRSEAELTLAFQHQAVLILDLGASYELTPAA
jgi:hypothetical protein